MFDPTAYDNMKVVMEGALYDLDLSGEIVVVDRNDIVNMAKMSRQFNICFRLSAGMEKDASAEIQLESKLANLAAELVPNVDFGPLAGCNVRLKFLLNSEKNTIDYQMIENLFMEIWGSSRKVTIISQWKPLISESVQMLITVDFDRLIGEDQMDDLVEMLDYILTSLNRLHSVI